VPSGYTFGPFEMRSVERQLLVRGQPAAIGARAFDVLRVLVENRGRLVTKNELLDQVWPGLVVEEANLHVQISALRKLLGPQPIATIPGQGYRFAATVDGVDAAPELPEQAPTGTAVASEAVSARPGLPEPSDTLIGRADELPTLTRLLTQHRLVSVVGPAGIGKTRLAIEAARRFSHEKTEAVCWIELASLRSADQVAPAIATAMGVTLPDGDAADALSGALKLRDGLLILDNCEHLVGDVAALVERVLAAAPRLNVLATTQQPLKVAGEQVMRLDPLAVPPAHVPLEAARCFGAVQLLEQRARAADRRFRLDADNIDRAVDLCRDLDGIALAIEMAASRLSMLGFEALRARLGDRLRLMRKDTHGTPGRHQTLRAALDWSYSLLAPQEQAVLNRLAVFAGSVRLDVAQQVAADAELDEWAALDAMAALVDKSLLQLAGNDPPRYRLLASPRIYAVERLAATGELAATQRRYVEAMARLANEIETSMWTMSDRAWLARYAGDYDDLELAFDLAHERGCVDDAIALATALAAFTAIQMRGSRRRRWRLSACFALLPLAGPLAGARILALVANSVLSIEEISRIEAARRSVAAWHSLDMRLHLYLALGRLAVLEGFAGVPAAARAALDAGRRLESPDWGPRVIATFAMQASHACSVLGDAPAYRRELEVMRSAARRGGLERAEALAELGLADAALIAGEDGLALEQAARAVDALRKFDMTAGLGTALANLCCAQLLNHRDGDARRTAAQAWPLLEQQEHLGLMFVHLSLLAARAQEYEIAAQLRGCADAWYERAGTRTEPSEMRILALADELIGGVLSAEQTHSLRAAGARLTPHQSFALAQKVMTADARAG
jgi:predicted ATPase/DNA-binding winged helix-turn-helix (wHTH) protein